MIVNTRVFGEIDIADERIIQLDNGIVGFPNLTRFALLHNSDRPDARIAWFVSIDEPAFALPVMDPLVVKEDYDPVVEDEMLKPLGDLTPDDMLVLVTITLPKGNPEGISVNLKAPIIINAKACKACQIILDDDYAVKYPIYDILQKIKNEEA